MEIQQIFRGVCPLSGRHFLQEKTPNSRGDHHHLRKIHHIWLKQVEPSFQCFPLSTRSVCERGRIVPRCVQISNWRHGLLWRMKRRKIGQNSSKLIVLFLSIPTGGSQDHKQSLMSHSVFCSSLLSGFLYRQLP